MRKEKVVSEVILLGTGAAPGVPALAFGFGDCDPNNPKNFRMRTSTYLDINGVHILIDTSPDLRMQLINNNIRSLDAVLYTHVHADHLHGIDDLREINRISRNSVELFASAFTLSVIRERFSYLLVNDHEKFNPIYCAALHPNTFEFDKSFDIKGVKITPIELYGHPVETTGYIFNDGEVVYIADFLSINEDSLKHIKYRPEVLVMPLTTPDGAHYHANLDQLMHYVRLINPKRFVTNHMGVECDYEALSARLHELQPNTDSELLVGYDGMRFEI